MCDLELDLPAFGQEWGVDYRTYFADALAELPPLAADGLVEISSERIRLTDQGRLFLRNIAMCFDPYLKQQTGDQPRYSRTA